jgi:hypothetical protein
VPDHAAETDAIVAELRDAGLLGIGTDAEGRETWTLTPAGRPGGQSDGYERRGRRARALLNALLAAAEADTRPA